MMQVSYDDDLVEGGVLLCADGQAAGIPSLQVRRFRADCERCYRLADPDERNAAFGQVHRLWFREWGLEKRLEEPLAGFPLLARELRLLAFRKARRGNEEAAELYVNADSGRHAVVALRPERLLDQPLLAPFLGHELMHVHDMVDPGFGYCPALPGEGPSALRQRLVRDRYRLLWDITIDGRLTRTSGEPSRVREQHWQAFERVYAFWPKPRQEEVFSQLWSDPAPRHAGLLALASDPRQAAQTRGPTPGGICPLCGFPTFAWADAGRLTPTILARLRGGFPQWDPAQGACHRCVEIFEAAGQFEPPATICL
jgi:hypothetical protein